LKTYTEYIAAGVPLTLAVGGSVLYVQRSEAGQVLDIDFIKGNASQGVQRVGKGFKAQPAGGFDTVRIKASAGGTVEFVVTDGDLNVQFDDANTIIGNDDGMAVPIRAKAGERIPVDIGGGTVQVTADNVRINNTDANAVPVTQKAGASFTVEQKAGVEFKTRDYLASVVTDYDPVAVNAASMMLLVAAVARRGLRIRNAGDNPVAIGGAGVSFANAVILIQPGETWNENEAPGAEWHCVTGPGLASTINLQTIA
jgi:plastocyanin